ncbi:MAG: hypothetical protein Q8P35_01580 [Candidatus Yanofskybacteria bacterium]|nr:hypothetical protein [Candidatus Yanofskybacteria bacterium]
MALIRRGVVIRWHRDGIISLENELGQPILSRFGDDKRVVRIATDPAKFEEFVAGLASVHDLDYTIHQEGVQGAVACRFL